jgi:hypothetical protein
MRKRRDSYCFSPQGSTSRRFTNFKDDPPSQPAASRLFSKQHLTVCFLSSTNRLVSRRNQLERACCYLSTSAAAQHSQLHWTEAISALSAQQCGQSLTHCYCKLMGIGCYRWENSKVVQMLRIEKIERRNAPDP